MKLCFLAQEVVAEAQQLAEGPLPSKQKLVRYARFTKGLIVPAGVKWSYMSRKLILLSFTRVRLPCDLFDTDGSMRHAVNVQ